MYNAYNVYVLKRKLPKIDYFEELEPVFVKEKTLII